MVKTVAFNPTLEQCNALNANGRVLVSAAAGSGKTAVLVERVANYILNAAPVVDADRLVVVTFTNAAAAEMRNRIAARISDELRKNPNSSRLKRQQFLLTKANISTIDSFCINLVREHFYKLDISPDFKIADNSILKQIQSKALDRVVARQFEKSDEGFLRLIDLVGAENAERNLKEAILQIYYYLRSIPFVQPYIDKVNKMYNEFTLNSSLWTKTIFDYAKLSVDDMILNLNYSIDLLQNDEALGDVYLDAFLETLASYEGLKYAVDSKNWDDCFKHCKYFKKSTLGRAYKYPDELKKDQIKEIKNLADATFQEMSKLFLVPKQQIEGDIAISALGIKKLLELVVEFSDQTNDEKKKNNFMDFADVEYAALKLLVENKDGVITYTDIAKELSGYYHEVLVDEYQDTNDLQDTIFKALSDNGKKLFMVGDVKQSIYRFRNANPQIFLNNRNSLPLYKEGADQSKVIMSGNFRSALGICDFINFTFGLLMSERVGQIDYDTEDQLVCKSNFNEIEADRVQLHIVNKTEKGRDDNLEPEYLAQLIKQMVGKEIINSSEGLRTANFGDIAILLRSRAQISVYEQVLRQHKIPVWADERGGFLKTKEIVTAVSLLKVIDNPTRDVSLLSLLMSDLFSFTADEVADVRANSRKTDLYTALLLFSENHEKTKSFLNDIKTYRQWSVSMPISELIRKIYERTGYINTVQLYDNGAQARANLIMLIEYAKGYESGGVKGLSRFLNYLEQTEKSNGLNQASVITEADDAVRIMTIHRSKGLQFPICVVAQLGSQLNKNDKISPLQKSESLGIGLKVKDNKRNISYSTIAQNAISIENYMLSMSEELRILYVALTRAKDFLVLSACASNLPNIINKVTARLNLNDDKVNPIFVLKSQNYLNLILASAILELGIDPLMELAGQSTDSKSNDNGFGVYITDQQDVVISDQSDEEFRKESPDLQATEKLNQQLSYKYPYDKINTIAAKQSASVVAQSKLQDKYWFSEVPSFMQGEKLNRAQKGTALHKFMQHCHMGDAKVSVENEIARLLEFNFLSKLEAASLDVQKIKQFFLSPLYKRIEASPLFEKEFKFMVEFPATYFDSSLDKQYENELVVVQGVVDGFFEQDGEIVIIDYKTDKIKNLSELKDRYSIQLKIYKKAIGQVMDKPIKELILYSFELSDMIRV